MEAIAEKYDRMLFEHDVRDYEGWRAATQQWASQVTAETERMIGQVERLQDRVASLEKGLRTAFYEIGP